MSRRSIIKPAKIERIRSMDLKNWRYIQHRGAIALAQSIIDTFSDEQMTALAQATSIPARLLRGEGLSQKDRDEYLKLLHGV